MTYLSPRALKGLKQYQYKSGGYTLLDQIHTPIWNGTSTFEIVPLAMKSIGCESIRQSRVRFALQALSTTCPRGLHQI